MRIISDWKDYYDSVQALGQDRSLVYVRKKKRVDDTYPFPSFGCRSYYWRPYGSECPSFNQYIVGFCGKVYPVFIFYTSDKKNPGKSIKHACFNQADVDEFVKKNYDEDAYESYVTKKYEKKSRWPSVYNQRSFMKFFEDCKKCQNSYEKLFIENYTPLFVAEYSERNERYIEYNANLREVEFFRVFDPYQAFQEISVYLGSIAVPLKPMPEIKDEVMAEIKGFDKWSFRKEPTKKRK